MDYTYGTLFAMISLWLLYLIISKVHSILHDLMSIVEVIDITRDCPKHMLRFKDKESDDK